MDADGTYELHGVPPGRYTLWYGDTATHARQQVVVADQPVEQNLALAAR